LQPTVSGNTLNLNVAYKTTSTALGEAENKYAMFLINVDMKAPMTDLAFNLTMDGQAVANEKMNVAALEQDPKIAISGMLDVELVKYIDALNEDVNAMLKACANITELKALVEDLQKLLTPKKVDEIYTSEFGYNSDAFKASFKTDAVKNYLQDVDVVEFYRALACATSKDKVAHKHEVMDADGNPKLEETTKIEEIYPDYGIVAEHYHYYSSPYALYFAWLKDNGYTK
jgi:hypothetical protein